MNNATTAIIPLREGFVGVHIGAGQHSEARTATYLSICAAACKVGVEVLNRGGSALEAACSATMVLEDAGETNAGLGSNLTESGTVEMDAGIMDGNSLLFGAVGAMSGIKNPILVAKLLVMEQQKGLLPLGRVPPGFLVGDGARDWAIRHGVPSVTTQSLISEKALKLYRHYKRKLEEFRLSLSSSSSPASSTPASPMSPMTTVTTGSVAATAVMNNKRPLNGMESEISNTKRIKSSPSTSSNEIKELNDHVTDTVGVVVMDKYGNVASTVSSGGIALKQPGRVGQASCFGCGCWAQNRMGQNRNINVGISTTGCGEHLVRTFLARECATEMGNSKVPLTALERTMKEKFAESEFLASVPEKLGGAICMHYDSKMERGEFLWDSYYGVYGNRISDNGGFHGDNENVETSCKFRCAEFRNDFHSCRRSHFLYLYKSK